MNRDEGCTSSILITTYRHNRRNILTFIFYLLPGIPADEVYRLAQLSCVEACRIHSRLQNGSGAVKFGKGQQGGIPLGLVLFCANTAAKKFSKRSVPENHGHLALLSVDEHNEEAVRSVFNLPRLDRSAFVLCAVLGLEAWEASSILKIPPVQVEKILARAVQTFYADQPSLQNLSPFTTSSIQTLPSDASGAMDAVRAVIGGVRLETEWPEHSAASEEALLNTAFVAAKTRLRRRRAAFAGITVGFIALSTVLVWVVRPWQYIGGPAPVPLNSKVKPYYIQQVGFAPRLPSDLPIAMKSAPSQVSIALSSSNFSVSYQDDTTRTIIDVHETQAASALPIPKQSDPTHQVLYVHGVRTVIQGTTNYYTVQFDVRGVHCTVTAQWPAFTAGFSKTAVLHLVRSMITHPTKVDTLPVYQERMYQGVTASQAALDFHPILLTRRNLIGVSPIPSSVSANIQSKGTQRFEVFSAVYTGVRVRQEIRLHEYWGGITESGGTLTASEDYAPVQQILHIDGHSVHLRPDNMGLYWYDAKTGIGFEVIGQPQSKSELISVMKNIMSQVKTA